MRKPIHVEANQAQINPHKILLASQVTHFTQRLPEHNLLIYRCLTASEQRKSICGEGNWLRELGKRTKKVNLRGRKLAQGANDSQRKEQPSQSLLINGNKHIISKSKI